MKKIFCVIVLATTIACKSNYSVRKTNINIDAYTNSKFRNGLIVSGVNSENNFYSLFYTEIVDNNKLSKLQKFKVENREQFLNISNGVFLPISNEFYFTSNNSKTGNLQLYKSDLNNLELTNIKLVKLELEKLSYGHSTFSENGLMMVLASMENSKILLKLYTRDNLTAEWKFHRNLDELNNSKTNFHPVLTKDLTIFYSQKNKNKIDLYYSAYRHNLKHWDKPKKIKGIIDSREKINYILINENSGFFTSKESKRIKEEEIDEIYFFKIEK
ncbi:hypothetical protein [uncultured Tenacibaculum sp.]|uniref:hypothetical protein n=1 Tax=uncultured Tenacibaculum sp. TaxID=174713 RepID=UPI002612357B|nr:hypothetical protein [uncultured Tenacibaculum sp.]